MMPAVPLLFFQYLTVRGKNRNLESERVADPCIFRVFSYQFLEQRSTCSILRTSGFFLFWSSTDILGLSYFSGSSYSFSSFFFLPPKRWEQLVSFFEMFGWVKSVSSVFEANHLLGRARVLVKITWG